MLDDNSLWMFVEIFGKTVMAFFSFMFPILLTAIVFFSLHLLEFIIYVAVYEHFFIISFLFFAIYGLFNALTY